MSFLMLNYISEAALKVRRNITPMFAGKGTVVETAYSFLCWFTTVPLILTYVVGPFVMLQLDMSITCWQRVYFYGTPAVLLAYFVLPGKKKPPASKK